MFDRCFTGLNRENIKFVVYWQLLWFVQHLALETYAYSHPKIYLKHHVDGKASDKQIDSSFFLNFEVFFQLRKTKNKIKRCEVPVTSFQQVQ